VFSALYQQEVLFTLDSGGKDRHEIIAKGEKAQDNGGL